MLSTKDIISLPDKERTFSGPYFKRAFVNACESLVISALMNLTFNDFVISCLVLL